MQTSESETFVALESFVDLLDESALVVDLESAHLLLVGQGEKKTLRQESIFDLRCHLTTT
jgi:hypothetical protein